MSLKTARQLAKLYFRTLSEDEEAAEGEEEEEGSEDEEEEDSNALFNIAIATIFAREVLEAAVIIGQYRTVINKSEYMDEERKASSLKAVTKAATMAGLVAVVVVLCIAIPLGILGNDLDEKYVMIIEGVSKCVAAICIIQLSVKIPVWLGLYKKVSLLPWKKYDPKVAQSMDELTEKEIFFNVAWNIWREVAECGVFLIPFFLDHENMKAIPISALIGIGLSLVLGFGIYYANSRQTSKVGLAFFMAGLTLFLSVGLMVGGCHEFEEVWGETKEVWAAENEFFSSKKFPFVLLKPFGYSSTRTVLQMCLFWCWLALGCFLHYLKYSNSKKATEADVKHLSETEHQGDVLKSDKKSDNLDETNEGSCEA